MVTCDVLKVLKLHSTVAHAILRTFKTLLVLINPEIHIRFPILIKMGAYWLNAHSTSLCEQETI